MYKARLPGPVSTPQDVAKYAGEEFQRVERGTQDKADALYLNVLYAAPAKTLPGMLVYADGTKWNPGSGEGVYRRNSANSAWVFLG